MSVGWREALTVVAILFVVFLATKMRPLRVVRGKLSDAALAAKKRGEEAKTPAERAAAFADAAALTAEAPLPRWDTVAALFLRAIHADPTSADVVRRAIAVLEPRRPRKLERVLWRALARTPWDAAHLEAARAAADGLAHVYEHRLGDHARAAVLKRWSAEHAGPPAAPS